MRKNKVKLYFILADENLFHPYYLKSVIANALTKGYAVEGITLAKDTYKKGFYNAVYQQIVLWGLFPFAFIAVNSILRTIAHKMGVKKNQTIQSIADVYKLPVYKTFNVNDEDHISYLKKKNVDIVISSNGHIFKQKLLKTPKISSINRHSALLPSYGGVLPVFWAMKNKEKILGTSVHYMVEKIDQGDILAFETFENKKGNSLFYNYMMAFAVSIPVTLSAIDNAVKKKIVKKFNKNTKTYYSFPTKEEIREFKKTNKSFVLTDILTYYKIYQ